VRRDGRIAHLPNCGAGELCGSFGRAVGAPKKRFPTIDRIENHTPPSIESKITFPRSPVLAGVFSFNCLVRKRAFKSVQTSDNLGLDRRRIDEWRDMPGRPIDLAGIWSGRPSNYLVSNCTM